MRIGITTSVIQGGKTGIAQYVLSLTRCLTAHTPRHEFTLFVLEHDLPRFDFANGRMNLVRVSEHFRPPVRNILWHQTALPQLAKAHGLDVLHVPSYRRLLWPKPCRLVATIHDLAPFKVAGKYGRARMWYGKVVARRLAWRLDEVIVISRNTARDVTTHFGLAPEKLTLIYNGIDHERFTPGSPEAARRRVADRHGLRRPFMLYVARLEHPGKNHVRLIEAFNRFKAATGSAWQLILAGSPWSGAEHIHRAIKASPYARDIAAPGFIEDSELPWFYRAARLMVYPSLYEGFGLPPIEAMACGCPVISSTGGALAETVGDGGIQFAPEDTAALARELQRLARDPDLRERLKQAGLARARRFNWRDSATQTMEVYQRAAGSPAAAPARRLTNLERHCILR